MMKAALIHKYGQKELAIEEVPLPTIHDNDVLVKISLPVSTRLI